MSILSALIPSHWLASFVCASVALVAVRASASPLLVVVETGPGAVCDAAGVRAAIVAELGATVVAPTAPASGAFSGQRVDTLVVAIDDRQLVLRMFRRGHQEVVRSEAAPRTSAAGLGLVAALAGAMTREEVAPPSRREEPARASATPATPTPVVVERAAAPAPAVTGEGAPAFPRWTLSFVGGAALMFRAPWPEYPVGRQPNSFSWSSTGRIEAHRHLGAGDWFAGAALSVGPSPYHEIGLGLLAGRQFKVGQARLEAAGGVGAERFVQRSYYPPSYYSEDPMPKAYAGLTCAVSYPLAAQLDAMALLAGQFTLTDISPAGATLAAFGLRVTLP